MCQIFKSHLDKFVQITDEDFALIMDYFEIKSFAKKEILLEEGQICKSNYFVLKGLLRKFSSMKKGRNKPQISHWKPGG
jgi:signal-transduction protein with cAMP-binding, CBS, and nucleotidyltransferase domain